MSVYMYSLLVATYIICSQADLKSALNTVCHTVWAGRCNCIAQHAAATGACNHNLRELPSLQQDSSSVMIACCDGQLKAVMGLLTSGADINTQDSVVSLHLQHEPLLLCNDAVTCSSQRHTPAAPLRYPYIPVSQNSSGLFLDLHLQSEL